MKKKISVEDAIQEAVRLLSLQQYQKTDEAITILRILISQLEILELRRMGYSNERIGIEVGVTAKTICKYALGDHCPKIKHFVQLENLYAEAKKACNATTIRIRQT